MARRGVWARHRQGRRARSGSGGRAAADDFDQLVAGVENAFGVAPSDATRIGEDEFFTRAGEKRGAEECLQRADLCAESGRGDLQGPGGGLDATLFRHGCEVAQVVVIELRIHKEKPNDMYLYSTE